MVTYRNYSKRTIVIQAGCSNMKVEPNQTVMIDDEFARLIHRPYQHVLEVVSNEPVISETQVQEPLTNETQPIIHVSQLEENILPPVKIRRPYKKRK